MNEWLEWSMKTISPSGRQSGSLTNSTVRGFTISATYGAQVGH